MKFALKLILTILFIPLFLILIIGATTRFQLLSPSFWQNTFSTGGTYSKLSVSINKNLETQTVAGGGRAGDVRVFTDLITPENLRDVIEKNIANILAYADGKAKELIIYVPVNKIPKALLSSNFGRVSERMKLTDLLKEFNVVGITPAQIQMISRAGPSAWVFLITFTILSVLTLFLLYLLVDSGRRLIAPGLALILAGIVVGILTLFGTVIRINWTKDLAGSTNTGDSIIGIIAPPVMEGILRVWIIFAAAATILGVMLLFLKKPYNGGGKSK